mmetsp:Transcript_18350/g.57752  ORF Transcript_18350/g.57752 Transcript_18350/m.57752 type:complete len:250 (-) Transcript_18350:218-967(-)
MEVGPSSGENGGEVGGGRAVALDPGEEAFPDKVVDEAEGEDVGSGGVLLGLGAVGRGDLRRHEADGAAVRGEVVRGGALAQGHRVERAVRVVGDHRRRGPSRPGDAEVAELDPVRVRQQEVCRLDVAVDDQAREARVQVLDGFGHVDAEREAQLGPGPLLDDVLLDRARREVLDDQRQLGRPRVPEELDDVRMMERRHDLHLALEQLPVLGLGVLVQDFDGNRRVPPLRRPDYPEVTAPQLLPLSNVTR